MASSRISVAAIQEDLAEFRGTNQLVADADYDTLLVGAIDNHITNKYRAKKNNAQGLSPLDRYLRAIAKINGLSVYIDNGDLHPDRVNRAIIKIMLSNLFASLRPRLSRFQNIGENDEAIPAEQKQKARVALGLEVDRHLGLMFASATLDKDDRQTTIDIAKVLSKRAITVRMPIPGSSLDPAALTGTAGSAIDNVTTLLGRAARIAALILEAVGSASQTVLETIDSVRSINGYVGLASAFLYFLATPVKLAHTAYQRYRRNKILEDLLRHQAEIRVNDANGKMMKIDRLKLKQIQYEIKNEDSLLNLRGGVKWSISGVFLGVSLAAAFAFTVGLAPFYALAFPMVATIGGLFALGEHIYDYHTNKKALTVTVASIASTKARLDKIKEDLTTAATALTDALTLPSRNDDQIANLKKQISDLKTEFKAKTTELKELHLTQHQQIAKNMRLSSPFAKAKSTIGIIIPLISIVGAVLTLSPPTLMIGVGILVFAGAVLLTMFALQMIHNKKMSQKINAITPQEETISLTEDLSTNARLNNAFAAAPSNQAHPAEETNNEARAAEQPVKRRVTLTEIIATPPRPSKNPENYFTQVEQVSDESKSLLGDDEEYIRNTAAVF